MGAPPNVQRRHWGNMDDSPHREMLLTRPTTRPLTTREVMEYKAIKDFERSEWKLNKLKQDAVAHRVSANHRKERMSSWVAEKSPAQLAFEATQGSRASKGKRGASATEKVNSQRLAKDHNKKMQAFENQKQLDLKVKQEQRGVAGQFEIDDSGKRVAHNDWEDAVRQNRTEARKTELLKSAVIKPQNKNHVEHDATHRTWGHLTDAEVADYGLIEGETLDEEGRVIPPWVGRAERYAGPVGEDEVRYPHDYGYGARGYIEASRGKVPPPQLHLKDKSAAPRRDPDLYSDVSPYVPYGGHWPGYDYNSQFGYGYAYPPIAFGYPYPPAYGPGPAQLT